MIVVSEDSGNMCATCCFWIQATGDWFCEECGLPTCERCGRVDCEEEVFLCLECFMKEGAAMSKPLVYLAGAMEKAGEYGRTWREEITPHLETLGYEVWNPYKEEINVGINVKELSTLKHEDFGAYQKFCQNIVDYDIKHLLKCTLVVCRLDWAVQMGAGTYGELTVCRVNNIPVYAWVDREKGVYDLPGWVVGCLTEYVATKDKGCFYATIPKPNEL